MGSITLNHETQQKKKKSSQHLKQPRSHARSRSESSSMVALASMSSSLNDDNDNQGMCSRSGRGWLDNTGMAQLKPSKSTDYYHKKHPSRFASTTRYQHDNMPTTTITTVTQAELLDKVSDEDILKLTEMAVHLPEMSASSKLRSTGFGPQTPTSSISNIANTKHHERRNHLTLRRHHRHTSINRAGAGEGGAKSKQLSPSSSISSVSTNYPTDTVDQSFANTANIVATQRQFLPNQSLTSSDNGSTNLSDDASSVNHNNNITKRSSWNPTTVDIKGQPEFKHPFLQHQPSFGVLTNHQEQPSNSTPITTKEEELLSDKETDKYREKQNTKEEEEQKECTFMFDYESLPKEVKALVDAYEQKGKLVHRMMRVKYKNDHSGATTPAGTHKLILPAPAKHLSKGQAPVEATQNTAVEVDEKKEMGVVLLRDLLIGSEVSDIDYKVNPIRDIAILTTQTKDNIHLTKLVQLKPNGSLLDIQISLFNGKTAATDENLAAGAAHNAYKESKVAQYEEDGDDDADEDENEIDTREEMKDILQVVENRLATLEAFKIESIDFLQDHLDTLESLHLYDRFGHTKNTIPHNNHKKHVRIPRTYSQPSLSTSSSFSTVSPHLSSEPESYYNNHSRTTASSSISRASSVSSSSSSATGEDGVILRPTKDLINLHHYHSHSGSQSSLLLQRQSSVGNNRHAQSMLIAGHHSVDDMLSSTITRDPFEERQQEIEQSIDSLQKELTDFKMFLKHTEELVDDVQLDMDDFRTRMDTYIRDIPESHYSALKKLEVDIESILSKRAKNPYIDTGYALLSYLLTIFALLVWIIIYILKWCKRVIFFPYKLWTDYQTYLVERNRAVKRASMRSLSGDNLMSMAAMMTATTATSNSNSSNGARMSFLNSNNGKRGSTSSNNSDFITFRNLAQRSSAFSAANMNNTSPSE